MEEKIEYILTSSKNYFKVGKIYMDEIKVSEIINTGPTMCKIILDNGKYGYVLDVSEIWYL